MTRKEYDERLVNIIIGCNDDYEIKQGIKNVHALNSEAIGNNNCVDGYAEMERIREVIG